MKTKDIRVEIYDVKWDIDGGTFEPPRDIVRYMTVPEGMTEEELEDDISDWLSDQYGWCHKGFDMKIIEKEKT